jgi:hypothetical protein
VSDGPPGTTAFTCSINPGPGSGTTELLYDGGDPIQILSGGFDHRVGLAPDDPAVARRRTTTILVSVAASEGVSHVDREMRKDRARASRGLSRKRRPEGRAPLIRIFRRLVASGNDDFQGNRIGMTATQTNGGQGGGKRRRGRLPRHGGGFYKSNSLREKSVWQVETPSPDKIVYH